MNDHIVVKAGSETSDPLTGVNFPIPKCLDRLREVCSVVVTEDEDEQTLIENVRGATVLMVTYGAVTRRVIEAGMPTLRAIIKMGTGIDSIDFAAARENDVRVANCADYARNSVAECAFMLMINCLKKFPTVHQAVRETGWFGATEQNKSSELFGKSVGLIGFGHVNTRLALMCQGFSARVQAYDPYVSAEIMAAQGVAKVDCLDRLADSSDIISICAPLNSQTLGIVDEKFFDQMKPHAFLINVGRGAIVDETALLRALKNEQIAGCGLDVFSQEPLHKTDHPLSELLRMDNVVISPHLAAWTTEAWDRLQFEVTEHVMNVLEGRKLTIHSTDPRLAGQLGCRYPG